MEFSSKYGFPKSFLMSLIDIHLQTAAEYKTYWQLHIYCSAQE